jgi:ribokinase
MNMDQLYSVERILVDDEAPVQEFNQHPGGSAANTIYGLAKLGIKCGFIGAVGDDETGKILIEDLIKVGVDVSQIRVKKGIKTGSALCLSDKQGKRSLYILPGANGCLEGKDMDWEYINQAKMLHLSSFVDIPQFELQKQIISRLDPSVKVSFAPGSIYTAKGMQQLAPLLNKTYILFVNRAEMKQLTGDDFASGAKKCLEQGCQIVVITLGGTRNKKEQKTATIAYITHKEGEYLIEVNGITQQPTVDTTGAGDAFTAGFLYGFLKGKNLQQCGILGEIVARFSVTKTGARAGLPTRAMLSQEYRLHYGNYPGASIEI